MKEYEHIGERVLVSNNQLIAINKLPGELSQPGKTGDTSLLEKAMAYCKHDLHIVNRLDRPSSGVVLFAKNPTAMEHLSASFRSRTVEKYYVTAVSGFDGTPEGELSDRLLHNRHRNRSTVVKKGGKPATTFYRHLGSTKHYEILLLKPLTGRHHQIRAQLGKYGWPIKGDVKYGSRRTNRGGGIHLHAWRLIIRHPVGGEKIDLIAPPPTGPVWEVADSFLKEYSNYSNLQKAFKS